MKSLIQKSWIFMTLIWISISASAYDIEVNSIYYNIFAASKTAKVTYGEVKYTGNISIPESISYSGYNLSVVGIDQSAFEDCSSLVSVDLPITITEIKSNAFSGCSSLSSISLPDSLTEINSASFKDCSSITSIYLPNSITSIGTDAFMGCTALVSINLPDSVSNINSRVFMDCTSLASMLLPKGVTNIGDNAFYGCSSMASINLPEGLTSIGFWAFSDCSSLTSIDLPNSVETILYGCFSNLNLSSLSIGEGIKSIGGNSIWGCNYIDTLKINASTIPLKLGTFAPYEERPCSFQNIKINTLIVQRPIQYMCKINRKGYYEHSTSKYENPFAFNKYLESIVLSDNFVFDTDDIFTNSYDDGILTEVWWTGKFSITDLPNLKNLMIDCIGINKTSEKNLGTCPNLENVSIKHIRSIGSKTFEDLSNLCNVQLSDIVDIGEDAFKGCSSLKMIELPASVESISNSLVSCPLDTIVSKCPTPPYSHSGYNSDTYLKCVLLVPFGYKDIYSETSPWNNFWNIEEMSQIIASSITLNETSIILKETDTFQLVASISPEDTTDKIVWSSSNEKVAVVSEDGLVTGLSHGEATITAICGGASTSCTVVVVEDTKVENIISDESSSYSIYSIDGLLIKKNCSKQELRCFPKGIYIVVSENGYYKISL